MHFNQYQILFFALYTIRLVIKSQTFFFKKKKTLKKYLGKYDENSFFVSNMLKQIVQKFISEKTDFSIN